MPAWTGGQYSLVRALFGLCLFVRFATLVPAMKSGFAAPVLVAGAVAALFFAIGLHDRIAALAMASALAWLFGRPLMSGASIAIALFLLLAHAMLPSAPYGSWTARGRVDPRGNWTFPRPVQAAIRIALPLGYAYLAWTKLTSGSWPGGTDLWFLIAVAHLFAFDPAWVPRRAPATTDVVQYDGSCGLCHRSVRFLIAEDASGSAFTFEPLSVESESVIVQTAGGKTLQQSAAVIHLSHRLGGYWRVLGIAFSLVPRVVRDAMYDGVARIRYRIFGRTKDACPLMPPDLRSRFL